jgi:hypothetical protein
MLPNSDSACPKLSLSAPALTITTMSEPGCNFVRCSRKNSRTSRFALFRSTEPPTLRLAVIPRRVSLVVPGPWSTRKCRLALPLLPRWIRRKSLRERTRRARVSRRSVLPASRLGRRHHGQTLATLGPTPLQHQPATRRGHTCTETMTAAPSEIAGLIGSFHGNWTSTIHPLRARGWTTARAVSVSGGRHCQRTGGLARSPWLVRGTRA